MIILKRLLSLLLISILHVEGYKVSFYNAHDAVSLARIKVGLQGNAAEYYWAGGLCGNGYGGCNFLGLLNPCNSFLGVYPPNCQKLACPLNTVLYAIYDSVTLSWFYRSEVTSTLLTDLVPSKAIPGLIFEIPPMRGVDPHSTEQIFYNIRAPVAVAPAFFNGMFADYTDASYIMYGLCTPVEGYYFSRNYTYPHTMRWNSSYSFINEIWAASKCEANFLCKDGFIYNCPSGKYCENNNIYECPDGYLCNDGKILTQDGSGDTTCPDGFYCKDGHQHKCPAAYYCYNGLIKECSDGKYVEDGKCVDCPVGNYCIDKTKYQCPSTFYQDQKGMSSCIPCPDNRMSDLSTRTSCEWCRPGFYYGDGDCFPCPFTTYSEVYYEGCVPCFGAMCTEPQSSYWMTNTTLSPGTFINFTQSGPIELYLSAEYSRPYYSIYPVPSMITDLWDQFGNTNQYSQSCVNVSIEAAMKIGYPFAAPENLTISRFTGASFETYQIGKKYICLDLSGYELTKNDIYPCNGTSYSNASTEFNCVLCEKGYRSNWQHTTCVIDSSNRCETNYFVFGKKDCKKREIEKIK